MRQIILASASPRRNELLKQFIGDKFLVYVSSYEESPYPGLSPEELLLRHSVEKARDVAKHFDSGLIISADTSVLFNGELLGKPQSPDKAEKMLKMLSGQRFKVVTKSLRRFITPIGFGDKFLKSKSCQGFRSSLFSKGLRSNFFPKSLRQK